MRFVLARRFCSLSSPSSHDLESLKEFLGRDLYEKRYHRICELVLRTQSIETASLRSGKLSSGGLDITNRRDGLQGRTEPALGTKKTASNARREAARAVDAAQVDRGKVGNPSSNGNAAEPVLGDHRFQTLVHSGYEDADMDAETRAEKRVALSTNSDQQRAKDGELGAESNSLQAHGNTDAFGASAQESPQNGDRHKPAHVSAKVSPYSPRDSTCATEEIKIATLGTSSSHERKVAQDDDKGKPIKTDFSSISQKVSEAGTIILALDTAIQTGNAVERTEPTSIEHQLATQVFRVPTEGAVS